jgi:beta-galactosidase
MQKMLKMFTFVLLLGGLSTAASASASDRPVLGAQVWIEPGQSPAQIDAWFHQLATAHMPVARLFLMWPYVQTAPQKWDFTLYDAAFQAAAKYQVKIVATLTPNAPPPFLGGDGNQGNGVAISEAQREAAAEYIAKVVEHYRASPALDTWLLVNEPGQQPEDGPLVETEYRVWLAGQYNSVDALNASWNTAYKTFAEIEGQPVRHFWDRNSEIDWSTFWEGYQTEKLKWLADQVRKVDPDHPLHLNPAGLVDNLATVADDLPAWRDFLDSLGCSIHPAWHFGLLKRDQYALGVSYVNDLVRGSIEPKPHWVTELQGGSNIYSAPRPLEPTSADIAQWVWTSVGAGADRVIFWLLNARTQGAEAGEWSLLDFSQHPSARLRTASDIAKKIEEQGAFFSNAKNVESPVTLILSLQTMTFEDSYADSQYPGRSRDAHILEALGIYQALSQLGAPPNVKHFDDYDWKASTQRVRTAILPDVRVLTPEQIHELEIFVDHGNRLLITGLTGFYDPHAVAWPFKGFPLSRLTGATLKEMHFVGDGSSISLLHQSAALPVHLWIGSVDNGSAEVIGQANGESIATKRQKAQGGEVIWVPSPIGLGAWLGDTQPLVQFLQNILTPSRATEPFIFLTSQPGCLLRILHNGASYASVVTNGGDASTTCTVRHPEGLRAVPLWGRSPTESGAAAVFTLEPRGTSVDLWR